MARKQKPNYHMDAWNWLRNNMRRGGTSDTKVNCPVCLKVTECALQADDESTLYEIIN